MYFFPIYPGLFNFINNFLGWFGHAAAEAGADAEMQQMFISYRGYCARKGVGANRIYILLPYQIHVFLSFHY